MNLLLALPTAGNPSAPFLAALGALQMPSSLAGFEQLTIAGNFIPGQRELAARKATRLNADVLVMLDDDMILPPDAIVRLVDALDADPHLAVAAGLYYSRDGLHPMVADRWMSTDTTTASIPAYTDGVTYCDAVGFGCVAIRVTALRSIPPPYFNTQVYVEQSAARVRVCNEDYLFCEEIRRAGWRVALHAGVRCKHYDRRTDAAYPHEWEQAAATGRERMIVVDPGPAPRYRLVPYDSDGAVAREEHAGARIDYILVD